MKNKRLNFVLITIVSCMVLASCGGGSGGGGGSKVKQNEYLGKLPSIYAKYQEERGTYKDKTEAQAQKLFADKKFEQIKKLTEEEEIKLNEMKAKFEADVNAESKTLIGREVPLSYSEKLKNSNELFYTVATPVKIVLDEYGGPSIPVVLSAKNDLKIATYDGNSTKWVAHVRCFASDGSTLFVMSIPVFGLNTKPLTFAAGSLLKEGDVGFSLTSEPALWANFAGVELCTFEEFKDGSDQRLNRLKETRDKK